MTELEEYYNKFCEDKRLNSRYGQIEFRTSMKYIHECIEKYIDAPNSEIKILDIGAGTGRYSVPLSAEGYDVTAVELVKYNLGILKLKGSKVNAIQGNATKLKKLADDTYDITLIFGPMYHLMTFEEKMKAMSEAKRVTKDTGIILVAYCMNEYSILTYGFKEKHILESQQKGLISEDYHVLPSGNELYDYVRLEDIDKLNDATGMERIKIISADGPANYMRQELLKLSEEEFEEFFKYHLATCERMDLIGAGFHTVDIVRKKLKSK